MCRAAALDGHGRRDNAFCPSVFDKARQPGDIELAE